VFLALAGLIVLLGARTVSGALALVGITLIGFALCGAQLLLAFRARDMFARKSEGTASGAD